LMILNSLTVTICMICSVCELGPLWAALFLCWCIWSYYQEALRGMYAYLEILSDLKGLLYVSILILVYVPTNLCRVTVFFNCRCGFAFLSSVLLWTFSYQPTCASKESTLPLYLYVFSLSL
jgi:hypothetical protein